MRSMVKVWVIFVVLGIATVASAAGRDLERERLYAADLQAQSPALAEHFRQATAAMDAQRWGEAEALLREVLAGAPQHGPTLWRLSSVVRAQGRRDEAISFGRRAVAARPGWQARSTLAEALMSGNPGPAELSEAKELADAVEADAHSSESAALAAQVALARNETGEFRLAVQALRERDPQGLGAHYFSAILSMMDDRLDEADQLLVLAEAAGLPAAEAARLRELSGINRHRQVWTYARVGGAGLAVWLLGLLAIYLVGATLSRRTLVAID